MMRITMLLLLVVAACKGETKIQIDPQTQKDLTDCTANLKTKQDVITQLQDENTKLQTKQPVASEVLLAIEGNVLTVKPGGGGGQVATRPLTDAASLAAGNQFIDLVRKSRGAIQKCYEQQLKKTSGLQSKTITLTVKASFTTAGAYQTASFSPSIGDTFDSCMKSVASNWKLPQNSVAMTFQAPVTLTPL
jgi:hypothetical protein